MKKKRRPLNAISVYFLATAICLAAFWLLYLAGGILSIVIESRKGLGLDVTALTDIHSRFEPITMKICRWGTPIGLLLTWLICRFSMRKAKNKEIKALNHFGVILAIIAAAMWVLELLLGVILNAGFIMFYTICYCLPVAALLFGMSFGIHKTGEDVFNRNLQKVGVGYFWAAAVSTLVGIILAILTTRVTTEAGTIMSVKSYVPIDWLICVPLCISAMLDSRRASLRKSK